MENANAVLVMEPSGSNYEVKIEYISSDSIPEYLNGESGYHVYHVRMLTELILKQLQVESSDYMLSDEEIEAMSVASSLHDIGKLRVPKSILDYPGKLSPVEYDIVKKHAVFGEEIINAAKGNVSSLIKTHAAQIARCHHERYDGTGYPDALRLDNIPIAAQVVSLADSFDALTSERSYKEAFSQDVAIEMIANGMCGVFNPILIECLLKVVNNKVLTELRTHLAQSRSVVSGQDVYTPKNVLYIGNTGYITKEFIEETFPESLITIVGETSLSRSSKLRVYNSKNPFVKKIFDTYEFDIIVYFATELSYKNSAKSDAEDLREMLECAKNSQRDARIIYLTSLDGAYSQKSDRALLSLAKEDLCDYYEKNHGLDIKIVRIPYLYSGTLKGDFLYSVFETIRKKQTVCLSENPNSRCYFISMTDLAELIVRFADNWQKGVGKLNVNEEFGLKFSDLSQRITELENTAKFDYTAKDEPKDFNFTNIAIRNEYGWFSKISPLIDIEDEYTAFKKSKHLTDMNRFDKIKEWIKDHPLAAKIIELFALFIITELLNLLTDSSVIFRIVDFRMAFIVIMASVHGLSFGMASASLSSLAWFIAKIASGTNAITVFYETTNWLAFVFFFLVGGLCGYIRIRSDNKIKELDEQNELLEEKLIFTRELYNDAFNEKRDLKKQILGSKDSFGKIFDVTRSLDTVEPTKLYLRIMDTFEDILENKSISVYSVNESSAFGRLEVASRDILDSVSRSISLESYSELIEKVKKDEIWRNTELKSGLPMYAAGVYRGDKLQLLIFIWHAGEEQRSLYYVNLFKILGDLVEMSLLRAYDYNQAVYEKQYIKDTRILNAKAFKKVYDNFRDMSERKVFSFVILEADCKDVSYSDADAVLSGKIRANDFIGAGTDGKIYILLSQASQEDLSFILPRFENIDISVKQIDKI